MMDNNENVIPETDDWSDVVIDDSDVISEGADETHGDEADQQTAEGGETENTDGNGNGEESTSSDQSFKLKYLGAEREVNRDEVVVLAQKGMDYDRIRAKYDEAQNALKEAAQRTATLEADADALDALKELAKAQNIEFSEFVIQSVAAVNAAKNGTSAKTEIPKVRLDFERKAFERQKADWDKNKNNTPTANADDEMQAEIDEFAAAFPEAAADAKVIPADVWNAKNADPNKSITQHYKEYLDKQKDAEIADLKARLERAEQNAQNKFRSTGQQHSGGSGETGDIWDRMWAAT